MYDVKVYGRDGCPKCFYVSTKMKQTKGVNLTEIHDDNEVRSAAEKYKTAELPIVVIDGEYYAFDKAKEWIDARKQG